MEYRAKIGRKPFNIRVNYEEVRLNSMVTFFNCGQGDCAYIEALKLFVDLGPVSFNVPCYTNGVNVLISHSHADHLLGRIQAMKVDTLYVPDYYPELHAIYSTLMKRNIVYLNTQVVLLLIVITTSP
ncbi:MAG: hypothetical protein HUK21_06050 [Fibrobacteraceae bacterium]|nr:hypothetical protein [Fibrobacteraceae bacterium]